MSFVSGDSSSGSASSRGLANNSGFLKGVCGVVACAALLMPAGMRAQQAAPDAVPGVVVPAPPAQAVGTKASGTRVHGTITDPDGELIPGATVQLTPSKGGAALRAQSGSDGTYAITVPSGSYSLLVTMPGFASYSAQNVNIAAAAGMTLDAKMHVGDVEVVTVNTDAIQLSVDPDNNASSTVLQGKDLEALSDDPDELSSELQALAGPSTGPNGGQIYVDGFTGGQLPPKSSIREIRINSNPFSAQYDRLGYGRIEVFTKPGTDKIHGNIQVNGDPSFFNSSNPLETGYQPPYHTIFMFGNFTGPLNKKASYNLGGTYRQIQDDEFTNATIPVVPGTTTLCAAGTTTCTGTYQFQQQTYYPQTRAEVNPRLDLALGSKNVLTTRYQYVNNSSTSAGVGNLTLPGAAYNTNSLSNIVQMSDTQNFSAKLINETRFEYEREHVSTTPNSTLPSVSVSGNFTSGGYGNQSLSDHQDHIEVQNYTSIQLKKNFIRLGGRLRTTREAQNTGENTNGQFTYTSLANYIANTPSQFSFTTVNNHDIHDTYADLGMYAETDWKVKQNLTVSYGFRYETQNHIADHHDFAPRVSFNLGLFGGKGAPKTVLRGGFGLFYDRIAQGTILNLEQENGTNETVYTVDFTPTNLAPAACNPATAQATLTSACNATTQTQTVYQFAPNLRTPYTSQFAIGADQQVGKVGTLSVNYLHAQGVHQLATQNINYNGSTTAPGPLVTTQGPIYQYFTEGVFHQDQLILNGRVQTSKRVSLFGYVSFNNAKGDTSGAGSFVTTPFHIANDFGRTTFDVKARYFISGSITLPHFILLSPFMIGQSGNPYNITAGSDLNNDSVFNDRPYLSPGTAANGTTVKTIGCGTFAEPGSQAAGASIVPINYCTGPSEFTFNLRITKTWGFGASKQAASDGRPRGQGGVPGMGAGAPPPGGGGGGSRGGGPGGFGGGTNTGKRYNVGLGLQMQNLFNNLDLATPNGALTSTKFGQSTQVAGGAYTTDSALRRIALNASFTF
jgi:hypothetical protein